MWRRSRDAAPALVFLAVLLAIGGGLLIREMGFWSDDYWHARIDPVSGARTGLVMDRGFFLRPLFYRVVPAVTTLAWHQPWAAHLVLIASHAAACALLWRLVRALGLSARAAAGATVLVAAYPGTFEASMWVAALPTSLAASLAMGAVLVLLRWRRTGAAIVLAGAMVFAACCLNEQPAAGVMALPVLAWAAGGVGEGSIRWRRWLVATGVLGAVVLAYVLLVMLDGRAPRGARGSPESLVSIADLPRRAAYFLDVLWRRMVLRNFWRGALAEGWRTIVGMGPVGWGALAALLASAIWWAAWFGRDATPRGGAAAEARGGAACRPGRLVVLGAAIFASGWVPIVLMASYEPDPRLRYWPCVGLAIVLGAALHAVRGRRARWAAGAVVAGLACVGAVMLVGPQRGFANRWALDAREMAAVRALVPDPPPYTLFIPLRVENTALATGAPVLDRHFRSVWEFPWTGTPHVQRAYRRTDIAAIYYRHWTPRSPVRGGNERGVLLTDEVGPRYGVRESGGWRVPWDRVVMFVVDRRGEVRVVGRVEAGDGAFDLPLARAGVTERLDHQ
ncbi:MAG: hypothetical protein JNM80_13845 [Phycisphaerae bacterium]|nr:hypothetical protein [Phycisphaerae bacterium]